MVDITARRQMVVIAASSLITGVVVFASLMIYLAMRKMLKK
jgi:hypothetical protein